jgi:hypothetical protein
MLCSPPEHGSHRGSDFNWDCRRNHNQSKVGGAAIERACIERGKRWWQNQAVEVGAAFEGPRARFASTAADGTH